MASDRLLPAETDFAMAAKAGAMGPRRVTACRLVRVSGMAMPLSSIRPASRKKMVLWRSEGGRSRQVVAVIRTAARAWPPAALAARLLPLAARPAARDATTRARWPITSFVLAAGARGAGRSRIVLALATITPQRAHSIAWGWSKSHFGQIIAFAGLPPPPTRPVRRAPAQSPGGTSPGAWTRCADRGVAPGSLRRRLWSRRSLL